MKPPVPIDDAERVEDLRRLDLLLTEPEKSLDRLTAELARIFEVPGAYLSFIDEDTQHYKSIVGDLPEPYASTRKEPREASLCSFVVGMNDELIVEDLSEDERFRDSPAVLEFGARFYAGAPLRAESGRAVGSLCILDTKPRRVTIRERELLRLVAEGAMAMVRLQVASPRLLDRSRQIERDLHQAVEVQRFLLPPGRQEGDGWRMEHVYRPVAHLGGDFVDWYERSDGSWAWMMADVSGHGASAALTTAMTKTAFRRAAGSGASPAGVLGAMNGELWGTVPPGQFVTAAAGVFDPANMCVRFASAGHPYPVRIGVGGKSWTLLEHANELALCVDASAEYNTESVVRLGAGERLLIYTDGAIEARNQSGVMLGAQGLTVLAAGAAQNTAVNGGRFVEKLLGEITAYASGGLEDDVALMSVEVV